MPPAERAEVASLGNGFHRIVLRYGFMESPDLPAALARCRLDGEGFEMMRTTFFVSRETVAVAPGHLHLRAQRRLFVWLHRNAADATEFFRIPRNRIVELGSRIEV